MLPRVAGHLGVTWTGTACLLASHEMCCRSLRSRQHSLASQGTVLETHRSSSSKSWGGGWVHYEIYVHWVESLGSNDVALGPWTENLDQCSVENISVRLSIAIQKSCKPNQENNMLQLTNEEGNRTAAALWDPATNYEKEDTKALLSFPLAKPYESLGPIHPWFDMAGISGVNSRKKFSLSLL